MHSKFTECYFKYYLLHYNFEGTPYELKDSCTVWSGGKVYDVSRTYLSLLDCVLWNAVAISAVKHCKKGDIVSIRGRIQSSVYEKDGETKYTQEVIGEKITFISSASPKEVETEN